MSSTQTLKYNEKNIYFDDKKNTSKDGVPWRDYSTLLALLILIGLLAFFTNGDFLGARNITNLARQISINAILAVGMTWVILTAGIDLSVGSVVALAGVVAGMTQVNMGWSELGVQGAIYSMGLGVGVGLLCGAINGTLVSFGKIPPFVVTLGMMVIARGLALIFSGGQAISPLSESFNYLAKGMVSPAYSGVFGIFALGLWGFSYYRRYATGVLGDTQSPLRYPGLALLLAIEGATILFPFYSFFQDRGLPLLVLILLAVSSIAAFILKAFPFGRYIYAVGENPQASELSGIRVERIKWIVYVFMGFLAGLCGVLLAGRLNSAAPTEGNLMELDAVAAVVIGGTSLMGGRGTILGSLIGAFFIGTLNNGMDLLSIDSNYQMVVKGFIIIFAVWSDSKNSKR